MLQNVLIALMIAYAATLAVKVARHTYLYIQLYQGVKNILLVIYGRTVERLPFVMGYILLLDIAVVMLIHPIGLVKCGAKWILYPIDLSGKPLNANNLVDDVLKLV